MGRAYTTVREHLLNLEVHGILEPGQDKNGKFWSMVAFRPQGTGLPSPEDLRELLATEATRNLDDDALVI